MNRSICFHIYHGNIDSLKRDISQCKEQNRIRDGDLNRYVKLAIDADSLGSRLEMVNYLISEGADFMTALDYSEDHGKIEIFNNLSHQLVNLMPV